MVESDICPKCGYRREPQDTAPYIECPRCGVVFAKYAKYNGRQTADQSVSTGIIPLDEPGVRWHQALKKRLLEIPEKPDRATLIIESLVFGLFLMWGIRLIAYGWRSFGIMHSFLHLADLPFHEFGHILFSPFGHWLMLLGGSLFQCLLPALLGAVFLLRERNPFAASFCLWWMGENFLDVAPYIGDARAMSLPLTGEWNDATAQMHVLRHDWHNLLEPLGLLSWDHRLAALVHTLGAGLMILAWLWGSVWLWEAWQQTRSENIGLPLDRS
ncbi:MAG: zinc ribbon domain-containing protein [Gammaproteobacteria bacterium]